jgi:hypothetical protein
MFSNACENKVLFALSAPSVLSPTKLLDQFARCDRPKPMCLSGSRMRPHDAADRTPISVEHFVVVRLAREGGLSFNISGYIPIFPAV